MSALTLFLLSMLFAVVLWLVWPGVSSLMRSNSQPATARLPEADEDLAEVLFEDWSRRG